MHFSRYAALAAIITVLALTLFAVACGGPQTEPAPAPTTPTEPADTVAAATATATAPAPAAAPANTATAAATARPTVAATATPAAAPTTAPTEEPAAAADGVAVFTLAEGAVARYKVEEVLANTGFKVATGETTDVSGRIAVDAEGNIVTGESSIVVQAATLRTDSNRRDGYVRNRTLETDTYPEVVFRPTAVDGLPPSLADANGAVEFTIAGDLTIRDQTRPVTWDATADFAGDGAVTGQASVEFTFDDFGMDKPRVAVVLSVEDTIRLELDFVGTVAPR